MLRKRKVYLHVTFHIHSVSHKLKKTIRNTILLLFFPIIIWGQNNNSETKNLTEITKILREVVKINLTENEYDEGIAEGTIEFKSIFRKKGGWTAEYLYVNQNDNPPIRIKYNETAKKGYDDLEFYYRKGELIYAKLTETITRGKNKGKITERKFYYQNSELIYTTESEKEKYSEYIKRTEKSVREMIYQ